MNKKKIITIVVIAIACTLIAGAVLFLFSHTNKSADIGTEGNEPGISNIVSENNASEESGNDSSDGTSGIQPSNNANNASGTTQENGNNGGYSVTTENINDNGGNVSDNANNAFYNEQAAIALVTQAFNGNPSQRLNKNDFTTDIPDTYQTPVNQAYFFATQSEYPELYNTRTYSNCAVDDNQVIAKTNDFVRYKMRYSVDEKNIRSVNEVGSMSPDRRATYELTLVYNAQGKIVYWARADVTTR